MKQLLRSGFGPSLKTGRKQVEHEIGADPGALNKNEIIK